jgi:tape measure domain-containing protein
MVSEAIEVKITTDDQTRSGLTRAEKQINRFSKNVSRKQKSVLRQIGGFMKSVASNTVGFARTTVRQVNSVIGQVSSAAFASTAAGIAFMTKEIVDAKLKFDAFDNTMFAVFGTTKRTGENFKFLTGMADKYGLSLASMTDNYGKFLAAAVNSNIATDDARDVFKGVALAAGALGLSQDKASRAFNALSQIASKGVLSMEELRQQLAEQIPGAIGIAARSMGMMQGEFIKLVSEGKIASSEFLPNFGREMNRVFGRVAERSANKLQASINRMKTSWTLLMKSLGESKVGKIIQSVIDGVTNKLKALTKSPEEVTRLVNKDLDALMGFLIDIKSMYGDFHITIKGVMGTVNALGGIFKMVLGGIKTSWEVLSNSVIIVWNTTLGVVEKGWNKIKGFFDKVDGFAGKIRKKLNINANIKLIEGKEYKRWKSGDKDIWKPADRDFVIEPHIKIKGEIVDIDGKKFQERVVNGMTLREPLAVPVTPEYKNISAGRGSFKKVLANAEDFLPKFKVDKGIFKFFQEEGIGVFTNFGNAAKLAGEQGNDSLSKSLGMMAGGADDVKKSLADVGVELGKNNGFLTGANKFLQKLRDVKVDKKIKYEIETSFIKTETAKFEKMFPLELDKIGKKLSGQQKGLMANIDFGVNFNTDAQEKVIENKLKESRNRLGEFFEKPFSSDLDLKFKSMNSSDIEGVIAPQLNALKESIVISTAIDVNPTYKFASPNHKEFQEQIRGKEIPMKPEVKVVIDQAEIRDKRKKLLEKITKAGEFKQTETLVQKLKIDALMTKGKDESTGEAIAKISGIDMFFASYNDGLEKMKERTLTTAEQLGATFATIFGEGGMLSQGIANAVADVAIYGKNWKDSADAIAKTIGSTIIKSLVKIGVEEVLLGNIRKASTALFTTLKGKETIAAVGSEATKKAANTSTALTDLAMTKTTMATKLTSAATTASAEVSSNATKTASLMPLIAAEGTLATLKSVTSFGVAAVVGLAAFAAVTSKIKKIKSGQGFQTGGSFEVGGSGGADSQDVSFRATPGEHVTIETPQQRKQRLNKGSGVTVNQTFNVQGTEANLEARLMQVIEIAKQQSVNEISRSIQRGAFA